ncbi:uncharacterized protein LOC135373342 isoform X2 [Ornithodoros turicata]|uniref:uncharacterized protein LOC135373342 isoform X2 n=1 Tax=Ornithodoros turicata TaxID=34597 RepID=UPI003138F5D7
MSFVERLPPMSTNILKCMMRVQNLHGLHVYYDVPIMKVTGKFPAHLFVGASVALLLYTYQSPVRFRVAIMQDDKGHYVEFGMFENEFESKNTERQGKAAFKKQDGFDIRPDPNYEVGVDVTKPDVYHWMEFRFTATKTTEFWIDDIKVGKEESMEVALFEEIFNYVPEGKAVFNNVMFTEMHVTCPKNMTSALLPEDVFIHADNLIFIGPGGSITIKGEFKKSGNTSVTIESKQGWTNKPSKTLSKPSGADGEVDLVIFNRGHLLTCLIGGKEIQIAPVYASYDPPAVKVKNFDTNKIEFRTGLSESKLVPK